MSTPGLREQLEWIAAVAARTVGLEPDPVTLREASRRAIGGRVDPTTEERTEALTHVLQAAGLVVTSVEPAAGQPLPVPLVVAAGVPVAVVEQRGNEVVVERPGQARETVEVAEMLALHRGAWLSVAPARPLDHLAHASPLGRLRALMSLEREDALVVLIYAAAVGALSLAVPIAVQSLVSSVAFGTVLQPIVVLSLLLLLALGFQATLKALKTRVVETLQVRLFARTALDLAWRLPRLREPDATAANRFFEVVSLQKGVATLLTDGISAVLQLGLGLLVLAFYHPALLAFDVVLVLLALAVLFGPARRALGHAISESKAKYDVAEWLQELSREAPLFRASSSAGFALERADALVRRYLSARRDHFRVLFAQTAGTLGLQVLASAGLLGLGGWLVLIGELTLGQLVAAELIVASVTATLARSGKLLESAYDVLASLDKLGHVLDAPVSDEPALEPVPGRGPVRLETPRLQVKAGERVAVVGTGKARIAELLAHAPAEGVLLNGVEAHRVGADALHELVAFVDASAPFVGTVYENIACGRAEVSAADARAALARVGLLDAVRALPLGLETPLDRLGRPFDHEQLLQLSVARAVVGRPRLLVVDAALDALGPVARKAVLETLCAEDAPWTLVALEQHAEAALARRAHRVVSLEQEAA
ncbi:MAG: ABC transporter ATP-binding protein [Myxococcaceae bacterium]